MGASSALFIYLFIFCPDKGAGNISAVGHLYAKVMFETINQGLLFKRDALLDKRGQAQRNTTLLQNG